MSIISHLGSSAEYGKYSAAGPTDGLRTDWTLLRPNAITNVSFPFQAITFAMALTDSRADMTREITGSPTTTASSQ